MNLILILWLYYLPIPSRKFVDIYAALKVNINNGTKDICIAKRFSGCNDNLHELISNSFKNSKFTKPKLIANNLKFAGHCTLANEYGIADTI